MAGPFPFLHGTGWRQAAAVNTIFMGILFCAIMTMFLLTGKQTQSPLRQFFFYTADCNTTNALNLVVHLLLNIISTMILSSSNFFMQVLNAPSRAEVDRIHAKNKSLEIGVPSLRNTFLLSKFKAFSWVVLAATSLPIHLFFNSAIFETDFQGKAWNLTIAAESFVKDGDFFAPGASLLNPGFDLGYGSLVNVSMFLSETSRPVLKLRETAENAATWKRLTPRECRQEYLACKPRTNFKDVVVVVNTAGELDTRGWRRSDVFDLTDEDARAWDDIVPGGELNSLWFSALCGITAIPGEQTDVCTHSCGHALGGPVNFEHNKNKDDGDEKWTFAFQDPNRQTQQNLLAFHRSGYRADEFNDLDVRYCLAQEFQPTCKLGVSTLMLGLLSFAIAIKVTQCLIVLKKVRDDPLVTPGDAVASFLADPDPTTEGMCTLNFTDRTSSCNCCSSDRKTKKFLISGPRPWSRSPRHMGAAIPAASWIRTYTLLTISLGLLVFFYILFRQRSPASGTFMHSATNGRVTDMKFPDGSFLPSLITANKPQILLSICYFHYNALFTRFLAEREWNSYSLSYRSLRVTSPEGAQRSTYRLQLPYKFSLPLIAIGVMLHWLQSNAFYLYIVEGGYYGSDQDMRLGVDERSGFHPDTIIAVSYSIKALLATTIVAFILILIPLAMARMPLNGDMVVAGADSRVMSAACHPRPYVNEPQTPSDIKSPPLFLSGRGDSLRIDSLRADSRTSSLRTESLRTNSIKSVTFKMPPSPYTADMKSPMASKEKSKRLTIVPPSPMDFSKTQTPSAWGKEKFDPQTGHDTLPPPTPATPMTPWNGKFEEERLVPLIPPLDLEEQRRNRFSGLRIVPPSTFSQSSSSLTWDRKLPWIEEKIESPTPVSPYPQSAVELKKEPGGTQVLLRLSRRKLRWGAVPLVDRATSSAYFPEKETLGFGHLTFGSIESGVVRPEEGKLYE